MSARKFVIAFYGFGGFVAEMMSELKSVHGFESRVSVRSNSNLDPTNYKAHFLGTGEAIVASSVPVFVNKIREEGLNIALLVNAVPEMDANEFKQILDMNVPFLSISSLGSYGDRKAFPNGNPNPHGYGAVKRQLEDLLTQHQQAIPSDHASVFRSNVLCGFVPVLYSPSAVGLSSETMLKVSLVAANKLGMLDNCDPLTLRDLRYFKQLAEQLEKDEKFLNGGFCSTPPSALARFIVQRIAGAPLGDDTSYGLSTMTKFSRERMIQIIYESAQKGMPITDNFVGPYATPLWDDEMRKVHPLHKLFEMGEGYYPSDQECSLAIVKAYNNFESNMHAYLMTLKAILTKSAL